MTGHEMTTPEHSSTNWEACPPGLLQETRRETLRTVSRRRWLKQAGGAVATVLVGGVVVSNFRSRPDRVTGQPSVSPGTGAAPPQNESQPLLAAIGCDVVAKQLPDYIAERLSDDDRRRIDEHLKTCDHCRRDFDRLRLKT
jgi:hypothetical protein